MARVKRGKQVKQNIKSFKICKGLLAEEKIPSELLNKL